MTVQSFTKKLTGGILIIMLAAAISCKKSPSKTVTDADNGSIVELNQGDILAVQLSVQMGTGFTWSVLPDNKLLKQQGKPQLTAGSDNSDNPPIAGKPELFTIHFKAVEKGTAPLTLHYKQPWEKEKKPEKVFDISVVVK